MPRMTTIPPPWKVPVSRWGRQGGGSRIPIETYDRHSKTEWSCHYDARRKAKQFTESSAVYVGGEKTRISYPLQSNYSPGSVQFVPLNANRIQHEDQKIFSTRKRYIREKRESGLSLRCDSGKKTPDRQDMALDGSELKLNSMEVSHCDGAVVPVVKDSGCMIGI